MKKIFKVASYDFKRLVFNPITAIGFVAVLIVCILVGALVKIPTTPAYSANITGATSSAIYNEFKNGSELTLDSKANLDNVIERAEFYINVHTANQNFDYDNLNEINTQCKKIYDELNVYKFYGTCVYNQNGTGEILNFATTLNNEFLAYYKPLFGLKTNLIIKDSQFYKLEQLAQQIISVYLPQSMSTNEYVEYFAENINIFSEITNLLNKINVFQADETLILSLNKTCTQAKAKAEKIDIEIDRIYSDNTVKESKKIEKLTSLITNYKLTCESAEKIVVTKFRSSLNKIYKNLSGLLNYERYNYEEETMALTKAKHFLNDKSLYYTQYLQPLNFNSASHKVSLFDYGYLITSLVGFLICILAIGLAYKLFGRDRRSGKMDIVLSQNVSFNQAFAGKFLAIVMVTSFFLLIFASLSLLWGMLFHSTLPGMILSTFNLKNAYVISPLGFFFIKLLGIELQAIFYAIMTIFIMNLSRKFELNFAIALTIFAIATICNIFLNGSVVYCLFPFIHADLTSFLGGATMQTGFLKTSLYIYGNFFISLAYYLVVTVFLYSFTRQLFKKN